jgi:hypothetical protein
MPSTTSVVVNDPILTLQSNNDYITTAMLTRETNTFITTSSTNNLLISENSDEAVVAILSNMVDKIVEDPYTTYTLAPDTAIATTSENPLQNKTPIKSKKRKRRVFKPREGGSYHIRSRT